MNKIINSTKTIDITTAQDIYKHGDEKVKEIISNVFPGRFLEIDLSNDKELHGIDKEGSGDYKVLTFARDLKKLLEWSETKYWRNNSLNKDLYDEAMALDDDKVLVAIWHRLNDDYSGDYLKGFYVMD